MCGSERLKFRMVETKPTVQYPPLDLLKRLPLGSVDDVHVDRLTTLRAYFEQNDTSTRHDERNPSRARSRTPRRDCALRARGHVQRRWRSSALRRSQHLPSSPKSRVYERARSTLDGRHARI